MELFLNTLGFLGLKDRSCTEFTRVLSQPKRFALLVFLSVEGPNEFIQRETLLSVFWPEESERRARNALSQALSFLRRQLPAGSIQTLGVTGVRLSEGRITSDVRAFREAVHQDRWAEALDLYQGPFLRGFHVNGDSAFEPWMAARRRELRDMATDAAWNLATEQLGREALVEAQRSARRALRLGPGAESQVLTFARGFAKAGGAGDAVQLLEHFASRFKQDLGLPPSREFLSFLDSLKNPPGEPSD